MGLIAEAPHDLDLLCQDSLAEDGVHDRLDHLVQRGVGRHVHRPVAADNDGPLLGAKVPAGELEEDEAAGQAGPQLGAELPVHIADSLGVDKEGPLVRHHGPAW